MMSARKNIRAWVRRILPAVVLMGIFGIAKTGAQVSAESNFPPSSARSDNGSSSEGKDTTEMPSLVESQAKDSASPVSLDIYEYWVADTAESVSFRLHIRNSSDSVVSLDRVEPSCGCILTTIQKSLARKGKDAEVYIALMTSRMNDFQPYTVDVFTSANPISPLRLYIRKKIDGQKEEDR